MNIDQIMLLLLSAILNGVGIMFGMIIGSKLTSRSIVKEIDAWTQRSETFKAIKSLATSQTLVDEATKFFKEASALVTSPEAKNFFENAAAALKEFSSAPEVKVELPKKKVRRERAD